MDRRTAAARCLVLGFEGTLLPPEARRLLQEGVGGVILFRRNVESLPQVQALVGEIRAAAAHPVTVLVDEEGGRVSRLRDAVAPLPAARTWRDAQAAEEAGRALGGLLRALGFDLDLAPVMDVDTNPDNPVIGDRSFGRDPFRVGELGAGAIRGLQDAGVGACAKHFPGHGDTAVDSHFDLPVLSHGVERLRMVELEPFRVAAEAGVAAVMTAHILFEALDRSLPATMSAAVLGLLREELGYDGWLLSDDLEMKAVAEHFSAGEAARWAIAAGIDALLVCHDPVQQHHAIEGLEAALRADRIPEARLREALSHREAVLSRFPPAGPRPDVEAALADYERVRDAMGGEHVALADPTGNR